MCHTVGERDQFSRRGVGARSIASSSSVDDEVVSDHGDSTFLNNFESDLGVVCPVVDMTIHDGVRLHGGAVVLASAGIDCNGRFAVLAEESEDEAEPELMPHRQRRRVVRPIFRTRSFQTH